MYPLNADYNLVPEVKNAVNSLFSDISDDLLSQEEAQLVLDVGGPDVEGKSGGLCGNYIYDSLLDSKTKEKIMGLFENLWTKK